MTTAIPMGCDDRAASRRPALALVAVVLLAALTYAAAAQVVPMPVVNPDELRYTLAARGLVEGEGLNLRGHEYGYGAVYPAVLASILGLSDGVEAAYPFFKVVNAALFARAAVPIFFVARRLLSRWWSVAVAAMSVAIPSSIYTSLVLTESVSYLASSIALLAMVLALERPSVRRQLALIGAVGLAVATRAQFAALLPAFVAGHLLLWVIDVERPRLRHAAGRLWPSLSVLLLGISALGAPLLLRWSSPEQSLGGYGDLWRGYDLVAVARLVVYHLTGLELYLFVVPFAVASVVVRELLHDARRGSTAGGAFVATFVTVNACLLLIAAAFASTPFGWSQLHGRYLFYVAPLWLVVFGTWLSRGMPRPLPWAATGVLLALVLPAMTPYGLIAGNNVVEYAPTALWSGAWAFLEGYPIVDGRRALVATRRRAGRRRGRRTQAPLGGPAHRGRRGSPRQRGDGVGAGGRCTGGLRRRDDATRTWVDDTVPDGSSTTKVYAAPRHCPLAEVTRQALFLTEFFNASVDRAVSIGRPRTAWSSTASRSDPQDGSFSWTTSR
jgi:hypothetical protein